MEVGVDLYLEIYIDVIFLINFIMDIILLLIVKKVLKCSGSKLRLALAATAGSLGACIMAIVPNMMALLQFLISYLFLSFLMVIIAFKEKRWKLRVRMVAVLYITTFFLGGVFNSLYYYSKLGYYFRELMNGRLIQDQNVKKTILSLIIGTIAVYAFVKTLHSFRNREVQILPTEFHYGNKTIQTMGLLDTGNNLYDPIYGRPVIISEYSVLATIFTERQACMLKNCLNNLDGKINSNQWLNEMDDKERLNIVMIPFQSVGRKNGILPAIVMDHVNFWIGEEQICNDKVLVGVSMNQLSKQNKYQVILHRDLM